MAGENHRMTVPNLHLHGTFRNHPNASHVTAAVQTLLHLQEFRRFIVEDTTHREACKSLLQCMTCSFHRTLETINGKRTVDSSFYIAKWNWLSSRMSYEQQQNPYEVLFLFITRIRLEYLQRSAEYTLEDLQKSPISKMFQGVKCYKVDCSLCGIFHRNEHMLSLVLDVEVEDLAAAVEEYLTREINEPCAGCRREASAGNTMTYQYPKYIILHCKRLSPKIRLDINMNFGNKRFKLNSCIAEKFESDFVFSECTIFTSICPDGRIRQYQNGKMEYLTREIFLNSSLLQTSKLTLIYEEYVSKVPHNKMIDGLKISSFPPSVIPLKCTTGISSSECNVRHRTIATQTPLVTTCDVKLDTSDLVVPLISFVTCKKEPKFKFFTGLSVDEFEALYDLLGRDEVIRKLKLNYNVNTPQKIGPSKVSGRDRLFMFLLRLRRGLPLEELAFCFKVSPSYVGELCYVMTRHLYSTFKNMEDAMFPSAAAQCKGKPKVMMPFPGLRIILDGASFFIQQPTNFEQQGNTFSSYKAHNVLLVIIGISCSGATIFCSEGFEGSISDKEAVLKSGLLKRLQKGDGVMTDRGFELTSELQALGCRFYKPPSKGDRDRLSPEEEMLTKQIAAARIYTEHAIADIKDNRLLQGVIPLTLLPVLSQLVYSAAYLRNFSASRILNKSFVVKSTESDLVGLE